MEAITVEVTQDDIVNGHVGNCRECPIAQAVTRMFPDYAVRVGSARVWLGTKGTCTASWTVATYDLPQEARVFVQRFDNFEQVEPFTFTMELEGDGAE